MPATAGGCRWYWRGLLFAGGRRTVTSWLRAAGVSVDDQDFWHAFYCTDPAASVPEILEAFADRATIEQDFHDVKQVWGAGQQQVRNIWANLAVYNLNLWMHTLVELWAWDKSGPQLVDRRDGPWGDPTRRPSHANRRKALRRQILDHELSSFITATSLPQENSSASPNTSWP